MTASFVPVREIRGGAALVSACVYREVVVPVSEAIRLY
jgi:hypothetical protein